MDPEEYMKKKFMCSIELKSLMIWSLDSNSDSAVYYLGCIAYSCAMGCIHRQADFEVQPPPPALQYPRLWLETGLLERQLNWNEFIRVYTNPIWQVSLSEEETEARSDEDTEDSLLQATERPRSKAALPMPWSQNLQNNGKDLCCLKHLVYDIFYGSPSKQTQLSTQRMSATIVIIPKPHSQRKSNHSGELQ